MKENEIIMLKYIGIACKLMMTMIIDNGNILFDHNVQIKITIFNSLENQIINWSGD